MLELESGSNDPMAYMLTIVLIQFIQSAGMGVGAIAASFIIQFIVGAAAGYVLGKLAIRYGVTIDQICRLNGITRNTVLRLGKKLRIK